jgi:hypothetical protein
MKLFIVHVGFYDEEIGIYELHTNWLVAASDILEVKEIVKNKEIFQKRQMHIDAIQEIDVVDGYKVTLEKNRSCENKLTNYSYNQINTPEVCNG